ncbi:MAG: response regulator [Anaerolineae bacterium]
MSLIDPDPDVAGWVVLIVEDEPDNLDVACQVLMFFGAEVHTATNGIEALARVKEIKPTFILMDLSMPKMDGWKAFAKLRSNPETAAIPVIALTAHAMDSDKKRVNEAGFNGYITKPFMIETFVADIKNCLKQPAGQPVTREEAG